MTTEKKDGGTAETARHVTFSRHQQFPRNLNTRNYAGIKNRHSQTITDRLLLRKFVFE